MVEQADTKDLREDWTFVQNNLKAELGETTFRSWLAPLQYEDVVDDKTVTLSVPTTFLKNWITRQYIDRLRFAWNKQNKQICFVNIVLRQESAVSEQAGVPAGASSVASRNVATPSSAASESKIMDVGATLDPRFTFEEFIVGKPNELAFAAAQRVAENKEAGFNPLFLYGGVGLGKTHLMHAIAWRIREVDPKRKVLYLSAEAFMFQFIKALRYKNTMDFKALFRSVDILMIDDIQFICGKNSTQEEFFHTFNALIDQNKQIVLSADKSPSNLDGLEERLRSRMAWGLVADIHPTDYELRLGILQNKIEKDGVNVPENVLEFLAHKITSNVRELEGALTRIMAHATLVGRPLTLASTQDVLKDLLRANNRKVTLEEIQKIVAEHHAIKISDMHSSRRSRSIARPRQIAMYLCKELTTKSLPEIGRKFGGRDHTTVMHAVKKVKELMQTEHGFAEDVELLKKMLES
ncbi:MAG: chromosomal replication initiator protein DnaA [Alphaproteobacteria bacterium]